MKLLSWNVNGIRASFKHGFLSNYNENGPDIICLQEIKAKKEQLGEEITNYNNYYSYWHSAQKPGYSGVAIYSKTPPLEIQEGIGMEEFDKEGRVLIAKYPNFYLLNAYFPNSQELGARLNYKISFCNAIFEYCENLISKGENIIVCGDFNIAHQPIDLENPKANEKNAGYLPEERAWMDQFLQSGHIDTFRHFNKNPKQYTWWSYRFKAREKNNGWRIDYFTVNKNLEKNLKNAQCLSELKGSDHCPVLLELDF